VRDFHDLKVWQRSHQLTLEIYQATQTFPKEEIYGLTSQIRRASASIPANLAEGCGKQGPTELARYSQIAMGSASELEYHLLLSHDLHYLDDAHFTKLTTELVEIRRMLNVFLHRLRSE